MKNKILMLIAVSAIAGLIVWGCKSGQVFEGPGEIEQPGESIPVYISSGLGGSTLNLDNLGKNVVSPTGSTDAELLGNESQESADITKCWFELKGASPYKTQPDGYNYIVQVADNNPDNKTPEQACIDAGYPRGRCLMFYNNYEDFAAKPEVVTAMVSGSISADTPENEYVLLVAKCSFEITAYGVDPDVAWIRELMKVDHATSDLWPELDTFNLYDHWIDNDYQQFGTGYTNIEFINGTINFDPNDSEDQVEQFPGKTIHWLDITSAPTDSDSDIKFTKVTDAPVYLTRTGDMVERYPGPILWSECFVTNRDLNDICIDDYTSLASLLTIRDATTNEIISSSRVDASGIEWNYSGEPSEAQIISSNLTWALDSLLAGEKQVSPVLSTTESNGIITKATQTFADAWKYQLETASIKTKAQVVKLADDKWYSHVTESTPIVVGCASSDLFKVDSMVTASPSCYTDYSKTTPYDELMTANFGIANNGFVHVPDNVTNAENGYMAISMPGDTVNLRDISAVYKEAVSPAPGYEDADKTIEFTLDSVSGIDSWVSDSFNFDAFLVGASGKDTSDFATSYYAGLAYVLAGQQTPSLYCISISYHDSAAGENIQGAAYPCSGSSFKFTFNITQQSGIYTTVSIDGGQLININTDNNSIPFVANGVKTLEAMDLGSGAMLVINLMAASNDDTRDEVVHLQDITLTNLKVTDQIVGPLQMGMGF
jgi:hypothetical protein